MGMIPQKQLEWKVIRLEKIICDDCEGEGTRLYPAVYVNGDLYQDAEVLPCDTCGGSGKVPAN